MLKKILIVVALIVIVLAIVAALQPADFRISRSATISAPPAVVFAQVNDLHKWEAWSPWAKIDPAMKRTYDGPPAGVGAVYKWVGNSEVGEGQLTITESRPNDLVGMKLEFVRPFACTNAVEFTLKPDGDKTAVTWGMTGRNNFMAKAAGLFMNMDKMVGGDFERGLANLEQVSAAAK